MSDTENTPQIEGQSRLRTVQEKAALIRANWLTWAISQDGKVLTAAHVVQAVDQVGVELADGGG